MHPGSLVSFNITWSGSLSKDVNQPRMSQSQHIHIHINVRDASETHTHTHASECQYVAFEAAAVMLERMRGTEVLWYGMLWLQDNCTNNRKTNQSAIVKFRGLGVWTHYLSLTHTHTHAHTHTHTHMHARTHTYSIYTFKFRLIQVYQFI